ncbi:type II secretion system F family protein [Candidatus Pacearchaeota archaeon]|nr:type II secretion system F family protein [Candidatus Pacearchaeota archaeon]
MNVNKTWLIGLIAGTLIIIADVVFFSKDKIFMFIMGIAILIASAPFIINLTRENKRDEEINSMFLEFSRNLAESVTTGTPISKSIINVSKKNYGALSPYIKKLANQISLGIPVSSAMQTFSNEIDNKVIRRAVELIREAEKAGGEIDYILDSVARSMAETEKLKKEKRAAIYGLVMQGYIIFFIFIGIMLVMEFKILPLTYGTAGEISLGNAELGAVGIGANSAKLSPEEISKMFLYLLITQGFFAGFVIGKLSEGSLRAGIKHSFILTIAALLISTGVRAIIS